MSEELVSPIESNVKPNIGNVISEIKTDFYINEVIENIKDLDISNNESCKKLSYDNDNIINNNFGSKSKIKRRKRKVLEDDESSQSIQKITRTEIKGKVINSGDDVRFSFIVNGREYIVFG